MTHSHLGAALVTGASSGIGAIYADRLAHRGYDLILAARDGVRLEALASRLRAETGRSVAVVPADLTNPADLEQLLTLLRNDQRITLLVNNAGKALEKGLLETSGGDLEDLIALNITAPTLLAGAAAKAFAARGAGAIVNISSVLALAPELLEGAYSGSKAYLLNLSRKLAIDLAPHGVHVQAVLPGATRTEIWERSGLDVNSFPAEAVMAATDLVDAALAGLDRRETVTIPPLADERLWTTYNDARLALAPHLSRRDVAARYREAVAA